MFKRYKKNGGVNVMDIVFYISDERGKIHKCPVIVKGQDAEEKKKNTQKAQEFLRAVWPRAKSITQNAP